MTLWLKVSEDKYELPEFVTDDIKELAIRFNSTPRTIRSMVRHARKRNGRCKYAKVRVEEE